MTRKRRVGVIGSMVWDVIYGRHANIAPIEEWGGVSYAMAGLDAALDPDWEIVPILKVGDDLIDRATQFISTFQRLAPDAALIGVPYPNNRVELHYIDDERRTETMTGGVPGWRRPAGSCSSWPPRRRSGRRSRRRRTTPRSCSAGTRPTTPRPSPC